MWCSMPFDCKVVRSGRVYGILRLGIRGMYYLESDGRVTIQMSSSTTETVSNCGIHHRSVAMNIGSTSTSFLSSLSPSLSTRRLKKVQKVDPRILVEHGASRAADFTSFVSTFPTSTLHFLVIPYFRASGLCLHERCYETSKRL